MPVMTDFRFIICDVSKCIHYPSVRRDNNTKHKTIITSLSLSATGEGTPSFLKHPDTEFQTCIHHRATNQTAETVKLPPAGGLESQNLQYAIC